MLLFVVMAIFSWLNIRVMSKFDSWGNYREEYRKNIMFIMEW